MSERTMQPRGVDAYARAADRRPLPLAPRGAPVCTDGHCVTCSDEGVPMRVLELMPNAIAVCEDDQGARTEVMTELVAPTFVGDRVLVHAATAIARLEPRPHWSGGA